MKIDVYLVSGSHASFDQPDAGVAQENLGRLRPEELFTHPNVTVVGDEHWTAFPTSAVARIEVTHEPLPEWRRDRNIEDVVLLPEAEFNARKAANSTSVSDLAADAAFMAYLELEERTGVRHLAEVRGKALPHVARARGLDRLLESPCVVARRGESTAVLINPANLAAVHVFGTGEHTIRSLKANRR